MSGIFYGWWIVFAGSVLGFYVAGSVGFGFTAFFEPLAEEFGWSYTQISIATSIRGLEFGILGPIMGFLVDRFGPRKLVFFGSLIIGFGFILLSRTSSLAMFYGGFVLIAMGMSAVVGLVLTTAVANWFQRNVGKALGIMSSGFGAGGLLVLLIVRLIDVYQWRATFVILGLGMWFLGIPLSLIIRHRPEQYGYLPDGWTSAAPVLTHKGQGGDVSLKKALKTRAFWQICIADSIRIMVCMTVTTHIMPYLSSVGMSRSNAALVATAIPLLSILGRVGFGWFGDMFDKRYVMTGAYFLAGLGLLAFSYVQTRWFILPFLILFPSFWGAAVLRGALVREYFGRASFGRITGIMVGLATVFRITGAPLAGFAYDTSGSYHLIWLVFTGIIATGVILVLTVKPFREQVE
jgi:sugar phosphate permease